MNRQDKNPEHVWHPCAPGTIGRLHRQRLAKRTLPAAMWRGSAVLLTLLVMGLGWHLTANVGPAAPAGDPLGGVTCQQVQDHLPKSKLQVLEPAMGNEKGSGAEKEA